MFSLWLAILLWIAGAIYYDVTGAGRWAWLWSSLWIGAVLGALAYWQPLLGCGLLGRCRP